jgi:peptidoglycan DL-endopeptidase CwlO
VTIWPGRPRGRAGRAGAGGGPGRGLVVALVCAVALLLMAALLTPVMMFASSGLLAESGTSCTSGGRTSNAMAQPVASQAARDSIPANYLALFQSVGAQYRVPWVILAGIGKVESDDGQTTLPGVHSGANPFGAAGPMQIGIGGAAGNQWGGAPVHPASEKVNGVATDANGDGIASVYDPADAIAGAAKYLLEHGVLTNVDQAIFAYNHLESYVQAVLSWAHLYASGGDTVGQATLVSSPQCLPGVTLTSTSRTTSAAARTAVAAVISYAEEQLGKPYLWGGTGPDAFDCSGLVMMAYRAAGIDIPRTSQQQWVWGPRVSASQVQPGDLVFFVGSDGTATAPGHVGLVIGGGLMIEAYATGFPIRIAPYGDRNPVGFTRPWAHAGVTTSVGIH